MKAWGRFLTRGQNLLALFIIVWFVGVASGAQYLSPADPDNPGSAVREVIGLRRNIPHPPSGQAPLGTTANQWDVFYTLVWGARWALRFGLSVTAATAVLGVLAGAASAYLGGWFEALVMRVTDAFLAFPAIAGVVVFQQVFSPRSSLWFFFSDEVTSSPFVEWLQARQPDPIFLALILFSWMPYARLMHTTVAQIKGQDFILASQAQGAGSARIILRHLLPNAISPAVVLAARDVGGMVVLEAAFTFIGLGGSGPWGSLLVSSRDWIVGPGGNLLTYWWVYLPITAALVLFGVGWNLLGDGLNTAINPRRRY